MNMNELQNLMVNIVETMDDEKLINMATKEIEECANPDCSACQEIRKVLSEE